MNNNVVNTKYTTFDLMFTLDEIKMIYESLLYRSRILCSNDHLDLADKIKDKMLLAGVDLDKE